MLLKLCPEIQGLTMRVHGESGIPEGSYAFWETLFAAVKGCGRTIEIDMHAKGVDEKMIDIAVATGMPVKLGAKYSAEHQSLGYQQADIRALEIPKPGHAGEGPFSLSSGSRSFTRYGYADFLEGRQPLQAALPPVAGNATAPAFSRPGDGGGVRADGAFLRRGWPGFDGAADVQGQGRLGAAGRPMRVCRCGARIPSTIGKSLSSTTACGAAGSTIRMRIPRRGAAGCVRHFGAGTVPMETAVAHASRLLPLVTSAHLPSASNHSFWPEINTNMPIVIGSEPSPYSDTPEPKCFGTVSPLDPQTFSTVEEHAGDLLAGSMNPKYSPIDVAQWLEDSAAAASDALDAARRGSAARRSARLPAHGSGCADPGRAGAVFRSEDARGRVVLRVSAIAGTAGGAGSARSVPDGAGGMGCGGAGGGRLSQRHYIWKHADAARALERPAGGHRQGSLRR